MTEYELLLAAYLETLTLEQKLQPFPKQDAFISDPAKFLAAQCTRRAGKTNGLALRFYRTMMEYPGSLSRYIALTRDSAKDIMWPILQEMNETHKWGATFVENPLGMMLPNGSKLRLIGADMQNFIPRLRGAKCAANAIDEAQSFGHHLSSLIDDVLTPTMVGFPNSWLALTGTPGPVPMGTFFDVTHGNVGGYSMHKWSILENPHLPDAKEFLDALKARNKWEHDNPTYLREWCNNWVLDLESLLIKYDEAKSHYNTLPQRKWTYILGVDLGLRDSDALVLLGWCESDPNVYLIEEVITADQDITSLVEQINGLSKLYDISKIVVDYGGLGAKIAEEIQRRHHIPLQAADKARKMENVALLNDWLRLGRFKAKKTSRFAQDSRLVQIDWEKTTADKIVVKSGFHSDVIDACLYAFKESPAFTYQKPKEAPKYGSKAWADAQVTEMEESALKHFEEQAKNENPWEGW